MIGNDIVDLNLAKTQSNWQRKGFLNKIFTKKEQQVIKNAKDSFTTVWLMWSMKESAYKIYSRQHNVRFFAPKKFVCKMDNSQKSVSINDISYYTTSTISKNSIHTLATLKKDESITTDFFKLKNDSYTIQQHTTYEKLKSEIASQFNMPTSKIKIEKNTKGVPYIKSLNLTSSLSTSLKTGSIENSSISISHHGVFGAYAFIKCK